MNETIDDKLTAFAPDTVNFTRAVPELKVYLQESFGSFERIDYGTGHELNFVVFIFCMFKLQVWGENDYECAINCVFQKYMLLVRKI
jgi:serine/threonine-protein phosphatase 2A activator